MKLTDMLTADLRAAVAATERAAGKDSKSAAILRRELTRRDAMTAIRIRTDILLSAAQRLALEKAINAPGELMTSERAQAWAERLILWKLEQMKASERTRAVETQ